MKILKNLCPYLIAIFFTSLGLTGCHSNEKSNEIKVGVISGPEAQLMEAAKTVALKRFGLKIIIIEFTDYSLPNAALNEGSLDANVFQHLPFLEEEIKNKHYTLAPLGKTFIYPEGIYSKKIKNLKNLITNNTTVGIPNDPTNEGRALLLLQRAHLIGLKKGAGFLATPLDIDFNPYHMTFKELDAAQLTRVLPDVTLAVINTNYALLAHLYPSRDALYKEDPNSPYANLIVARAGNKKTIALQELVESLHSTEVLQLADQLFDHEAIAAWKKASSHQS